MIPTSQERRNSGLFDERLGMGYILTLKRQRNKTLEICFSETIRYIDFFTYITMYFFASYIKDGDLKSMVSA
jgi:hypothetical protein